MKIQWFGASEFLITTDAGIKILTDPFQNNDLHDNESDPPPYGSQTRPTYTGEVDLITISHGHGDHNYVWHVKGIPRIYNGGAPNEYKGVKLRSVTTCHGDNRGTVECICIEADGIRIWHNGDQGIIFTEEQLKEIGRVDVLITNWDDDAVEMPFYILDKVLDQMKPKIVFPCHHCTVDEFMTARKNFIDHRKNNVTEVELKAGTLPSEMTVILLKPMLGNPINFFDPEAYKDSSMKSIF
jgi:L-ascorbate metabolism protein UlaG (beta-lactamase superfamily)